MRPFWQRIAAILILLFSQSFCLGIEPNQNGKSHRQKAEKSLPSAIKSLAITTDGKKLLALTRNNVFVLDPTLSLVKTITIKSKDSHDLSSYWIANNMVISPDQKHVLVLDKYISLNTGKPVTIFDVALVVRKRQPNPTALDISPTGKLGLILVYSFHDRKYNSLALFDLKTGRLVHVRESGATVVNAVFASEDQLILLYTDGRITIENINGQIIKTLTKNGPIPRPGGNHLIITGSRKDRVVIVAGMTKDYTSRIFVFSPVTQKIIFQDSREGSVFVKTNSKWIFYQKSQHSKVFCDCVRHSLIDLFLKARNTESGQVKKRKAHKLFDMMVFDSKQNTIFCVDHDTLKKMNYPTYSYGEK